MSNKVFKIVAVIFILSCVIALISSINILSNIKEKPSNGFSNETGENNENDIATYAAAKTAYADVIDKYNKMDDAYNCIQFYKGIGGVDPNKNAEYREALSSYPRLKNEYEAALYAYNETFPQYPLG